jgi:long-chain fatty acid transport protein
MATTHPLVRRFNTTCIAGLLSITSCGAFASGFALIEQSVSSMGTAYAGSGSAAEDASFIFFNPASMSELDGTQVSGGLHIVLPETEFTGSAATNPFYDSGTTTPDPVDPDSDDAGELGALPHFAYVRELSDTMNFGITVNVPFGLKTEYRDDWVGRFSSTAGEVKTINLNPALSFEVDEHVTLGVGLSVMYANLIFENVAHFNFPDFPSVDVPVKIDIDDWGFGWNFGALLKPTDSTRLGIAYRSKVDVELDGDRSVTGTPNMPTVAEVSLPDSLLVSAYHEVDDQWAVMADITWTQWSRINALQFRFADTTTNTIPVKFDDSFRYAIGASYKYDDRWKFRGGLAFDETPVPSPEYRLTALPDEDRTWLTFGAGYQHSKKLSFDIGYAHLFIDDTSINSTDGYPSNAPNGDPNPLTEGPHRVTGKYEASVDIISAQVNWKFD